MDVTNYLETYGLTARELAMRMILDVLNTTGITATAGIGSNLYLCKIAMDIEAKHIPPDATRRAHRGAGREALPPCPVGSPPPDGLLAGGPGLRSASWRPTACTPWAT